MRRTILALAVVLASCVSTPRHNFSSCTSGDVQLIADFEGARAGDCQRTGDSSFSIMVSPEARPINPSPWYAFEIAAERQTKVTVNVIYSDSRHRYIPKLRAQSGAWRPLPLGSVIEAENGTSAEFNFTVLPGRTRIAAQELIRPAERLAWVADFAERSGLEAKELGRSPNGRPILALEAGTARAGAPLIVILGGQHPPEVPGVLGLRAFLESLLMSGTQTGRLLERAHLLIIPELNPDGVAAGHWRLNAGLVDINRDWGPFQQPETRLAKQEIDRLVEQGLKPVLLLDFHATRRNVFYTQPDDFGLYPQNFAQSWLNEIDLRWDGEMPARVDDHNPGLPTAKSWFAETFGAPAITFEFGDEADRQEIAALSSVAAEALADILSSMLAEEES